MRLVVLIAIHLIISVIILDKPLVVLILQSDCSGLVST